MSTPGDATADDLVRGLVADLDAERRELTDLLAAQQDAAWSLPTPAVGWTIHDQVAHLAFFDEITRMCVAEPDEFEALRDGLPDLQEYVDGVGERYAHLAPADMLAWWIREGDGLTAAVLAADPRTRVPWFGPAMSLPSKLTARIMETWAHGQDVADAIGARRTPSDRLSHVARIGVLALANSFRTHGLEVPEAPVRVELAAPDGASTWYWGDEGAADTVRGDAEDFCLVVTQRRHLADTGLDVAGPVAEQWMSVAQAFAGPAGAGRAPGQLAGPGPS